MVNNPIETHEPAYPLDQIRAAAEAGQILYGGRKVGRDIQNLGYTLEDVAGCIAGLRQAHYKKTLIYQDPGTVFDAYERDFEHKGRIDRVYMKLRLLPGGIVHVSVGSFHL
jgi:hypothetical protein